MEKLIDINAYPIRTTLKILLQDKTTRQNIIWATDAYAEKGAGFQDKDHIDLVSLKGLDSIDLRSRTEKAQEEQQLRTRKKAEVFTPVWLCNQMNNFADEQWFGRKNVFNVENEADHTWTVNPDKIEFTTKTWKSYVDTRRMEITCGEAPYLVSRYDAATGELILPPLRRIGLLDRKLRVVNENAASYEEWIKWVLRAFQSCYGFEYQGDNLLIARINLMMSFYDYYLERMEKEPDKPLLRKVAGIIAWNIWQMDGLKDTVPLGRQKDTYHQVSLFELMENSENQDAAQLEPENAVYCKIMNWRRDNSTVYMGLKEENEKMGNKKLFDVIIGNPPYQESDGGAGASATPVYNVFIEEIKKLNPELLDVVIPAKWYSGGKGLDQFRENMLNDSKISVLVDYTNSGDVFPGVDVAGGVCYFIRDLKHEGNCDFTNFHNGHVTSAKRKLNEFSTFIRYPIAENIVKKVTSFKEETLNNYVSSRKPFGLATTVRPTENGDISLRYNGGIGPYRRNLISAGTEDIDKYKIIISYLTAEHAGQPDKNGQYRILSTMEKQPPKVVCTETYLVAGTFDLESEADNYMAYLKTRFVRFLISVLAMTQHISKAMFSFVPVQDFSKRWTDEELFTKYSLSKNEISFIKEMIKEMV